MRYVAVRLGLLWAALAEAEGTGASRCPGDQSKEGKGKKKIN